MILERNDSEARRKCPARPHTKQFSMYLPPGNYMFFCVECGFKQDFDVICWPRIIDQEKAAEELGAFLEEARQCYYNGQPIISDAIYDAGEDELRRLRPNHPLLTKIGPCE